MSVTEIIASDYPLPLVETEYMYIGYRDFRHGQNEDWTDEADDYIKKEYKYSIFLEPTEKCISLFQNYLNEHMKDDSEVELWSIWLGTGFKDYYKFRPQLRNIDSEVYAEVFNEMDEYIETLPAKIRKKQKTVKELSQEDILFFKDNLYVCLSVRK